MLGKAAIGVGGVLLAAATLIVAEVKTREQSAPASHVHITTVTEYNAVGYSALGLVGILEGHGFSTAGIQFEKITPHGSGYIIHWEVAGTDGSTSHWAVTTRRAGIVTGVSKSGPILIPRSS